MTEALNWALVESLTSKTLILMKGNIMSKNKQPQQAHAKQQQTVLEVLKEKQDAIQNALDAHNAYEGKETFPQHASTKATLVAAVDDYCKTVAAMIADKKLKSDPAGVLEMDSLFGEKVDEIAKKCIENFKDHKQITAAIENAQKRGFFGTLKFYTITGAVFIYDSLKNTVKFIWNGIVSVYSWTKNKAISFCNWVKSKFTKEEENGVVVA